MTKLKAKQINKMALNWLDFICGGIMQLYAGYTNAHTFQQFTSNNIKNYQLLTA